MEQQIVSVEDKNSGVVAALRLSGSTTATINRGDEVTIRQVRKNAVDVEVEVLVKLSAVDLIQAARVFGAVAMVDTK
jgi:hypothetical protein